MEQLISLKTNKDYLRLAMLVLFLMLVGLVFVDWLQLNSDFLEVPLPGGRDYHQLFLDIFSLTCLFFLWIAFTLLSRWVLVGVWLGWLYVFCVSFVVFSLSAVLFQEDVSHALLKDSTVRISPFIPHDCKSNKTVSSNSTADGIVTVDCLPREAVEPEEYLSLPKIKELYNQWETDVSKNSQQVELIGKLRRMEEAIALAEVKNANADVTRYKSYRDFIKTQVQALDEKGRFSRESDTKNTKATEDGNCTSTSGTDRLGRIQSMAEEGNRKSAEDGSSLYNEFEVDKKVELYIRIASFEDFFWFFRRLFGIQNYWAIPEPILKINLVLFMGILGSLIFVSIEYLKRSAPDVSEKGKNEINYSMFFLRPFLGMIVALAMYLMVMSGASTFLDGAIGDLTPYSLSVLGIVSGMLAEQVYKRLEIAGISKNQDSSDPTPVKTKPGDES